MLCLAGGRQQAGAVCFECVCHQQPLAAARVDYFQFSFLLPKQPSPRNITRSLRGDHVTGIVRQMEAADAVGNVQMVHELASLLIIKPFDR